MKLDTEEHSKPFTEDGITKGISLNNHTCDWSDGIETDSKDNIFQLKNIDLHVKQVITKY